MRLGQLARQLSISPDKIVTFLGARDIAVDSHNNARIDDAYVDLVLAEFAPGNETLRQQVIQTTDAVEATETQPLTEFPTDPASVPELIKAPKSEWPGLRVIGKIDLPEKKKPEPKPEENTESGPEKATEPPRRQQATWRNPRRNSPPKDRKNPVALAREREEHEKQRQIEEERSREKERKAAYYQKRLKPQAPTKPARWVREQMEDTTPIPVEKPKTIWGKFMRWLNT